MDEDVHLAETEGGHVGRCVEVSTERYSVAVAFQSLGYFEGEKASEGPAYDRVGSCGLGPFYMGVIGLGGFGDGIEAVLSGLEAKCSQSIQWSICDVFR